MDFLKDISFLGLYVLTLNLTLMTLSCSYVILHSISLAKYTVSAHTVLQNQVQLVAVHFVNCICILVFRYSIFFMWSLRKSLQTCLYGFILLQFLSSYFCTMLLPPVRFAPSMVKQQPCKGSGSGFCRVSSAASLRFSLGSPRIWNDTYISMHLTACTLGCHVHLWSLWKVLWLMCSYPDFDLGVVQHDVTHGHDSVLCAVVDQQSPQTDEIVLC